MYFLSNLFGMLFYMFVKNGLILSGLDKAVGLIEKNLQLLDNQPLY